MGLPALRLNMAAAVTWATAYRPALGQHECGDMGGAWAFPGGHLFAVADGLGHGAEAREASYLALQQLAAQPSARLEELAQHCHQRLRGTRGVVMTLAALHTDTGALSWMGVGNVEGVVRRAATDGRQAMRESVLLRGGVIGSHMAAARVSHLVMQPGDTLLMATDGVSRDFATTFDEWLPLQTAVDRVLEFCAKGADDAFVLAARYEMAAG